MKATAARQLAILLCIAGVAARLTLILGAGNSLSGPLSGTADSARYVNLAESVYEGRGLTYAGQPTALRPPLYPVLLAGAHWLFGTKYFAAVRGFQFLVGLATALGCFWIARRLYGQEKARLSGAIALAMPTLIFCTVELQTEALSAGLTVLFLALLVADVSDREAPPVGLGVTAGASLKYRRSLARAALILAIAGACVLPWVARNLIDFRGRIIYSSHGGINALQGVLTPEGRAQHGDTEVIRRAVGWMHTDIETNDPSRLRYPSEDVLDRQAKGAAIEAWMWLS